MMIESEGRGGATTGLTTWDIGQSQIHDWLGLANVPPVFSLQLRYGTYNQPRHMAAFLNFVCDGHALSVRGRIRTTPIFAAPHRWGGCPCRRA